MWTASVDKLTRKLCHDKRKTLLMQEAEEMTAGTYVYERLREPLVRTSELSLGPHKRQTPPNRKVQLG